MAAEQLYGTLDLLVLRALAWRPMHGYGIAVWLDNRSGRHLDIEDGALYKALHRLEQHRQVTAEWGVTENKRRARYYHLTPAGRKRLREETAAWRTHVGVIAVVLGAD